MFKNLRDLNFIFIAPGIKDYNSIKILVLINSLFEFLSFGLLVPLVGSILNDNFLNKTYKLENKKLNETK